MKAVIQRVSQAHVEVNSNIIGKINTGIVVFIGFTHTDSDSHVHWMIDKLIHLRLFQDECGKTNLSLIDQQGSILLISQFTLYGDCLKGRRPSFIKASLPELAKPLYDKMIEGLRKKGILVETGIFGADMSVFLINDGPMTLIVER